MFVAKLNFLSREINVYKIVYVQNNELQESTYSLSFYEALKSAALYVKSADMRDNKSHKLFILKENSKTGYLEEFYSEIGTSISKDELETILGPLIYVKASAEDNTNVWHGMYTNQNTAIKALPKIALHLKQHKSLLFELTAFSSKEKLGVFDQYGKEVTYD